MTSQPIRLPVTSNEPDALRARLTPVGQGNLVTAFARIVAGIALTFCIVAAGNGAAQGPPTGGLKSAGKSDQRLKPLLAHLQRHYQETSSFKAKFKETITRPGASPRVREGAVYYQRPGRMRWEFAQPESETIVSDRSFIYDYDPGLNQVVEMPLKQAFQTQAAAALLLGAGNIERDFVASRPSPPSSAGLVRLVLTPKAGGNRIELGVVPKTYDIQTIKLADALGNVTLVNFTDIRTNLPLEASLFSFEVPKGADIVKPSGQH